MRRMVWKAECRMGDDNIDSQHRLLYAIANELLEIADPTSQEHEIKYLLMHLKDYVDKHFMYEEQFMENNKYPYLSDHKQKHSKIVGEIKEAIQNAKSFFQLKDNIEDLVSSWIQTHIMIEDKRFFNWYRLHNKN